MSDKEIVKGLYRGDPEVVKYINRQSSDSIKRFVLANNGSIEDAEDILQEALCQIYCKIKNGKLTLYCSFRTYFYAVSKNLWFNELRKRKRMQLKPANLDNVQDDTELDIQTEVARNVLLQECLQSISKQCQQVLEMYIDRVDIKRITEIMGFSSVQYAMNRRYICTKKLLSKIKESADFQLINDELY